MNQSTPQSQEATSHQSDTKQDYAGIYEEAYQGDFFVNYPYREIIFDRETEFQRVSLVDTLSFGRALFLDRVLNSAESDEFMYHEGIVHPAMIRAASRENVLIIGGAEGGSLREVLKYKDAERVRMVDIDGELVQLCREHLADVYGDPWSDERVELHFDDGREFLKRGHKYDVVILDLNEASDGSPAQKLFTREFYGEVAAVLNPGGMVCVQSEWINSVFHVDLTNTHRRAFAGVRVLEVNIPSYLIGEAFNLCTNAPERLDMEPGEIDARLEEMGIRELKFYTGDVDRRMGTLPPYYNARYEKAARVFTDSELPEYYHEAV